MRRRLFNIIAILAIVLSLATSSALAAPIAGRAGENMEKALQPGQAQTFEQTVPVQVVFLGYDQATINTDEFLSQLPQGYAPVVRYPLFYGLTGRDMGLNFTFDYKLTFAGASVSNRFFQFLNTIGTAGDPTVFQLDYNNQKHNVLDVTGPVLYIDAPRVENWLANNLPNVKSRGYTVVFVNWYSRPDFKFHVYTKTDEPDPDTGYNFGEIRASRKMIAWGGSSSRLWFYDLSAGPEAWTNNWNVDDRDVDGDGSADYRMPPIWEYANPGFRRPDALSTDLGMVTRYVGINLLFTSSPLYDPMVTAPGFGGNKVVHINMMEDDPNSLGTDWVNLDFAARQWRRFEPYYDWRVRLTDYNPIDAGSARSLRIFSEVLQEDDCWNAFNDPFAQLFCYFDMNRATYLPSYGPNDYVAGLYAFNTTAATLGNQFGLLGFADDNWADGTQSYVFAFDAAEYRALGYGFTTTLVHEAGHHFGMSHPHDGYDSELGMDYGGAGDFYFAWSGDESNTVMHYLAVSNGFGRFDRDNMYRYEMAGYLNWSSELLGQILADPRSGQFNQQIGDANAFADDALSAFNDWDYQRAATKAYRAYQKLTNVATRLGIQTPSSMAAMMAISGAAPHEGDPIRFPDN